MNTPIKVLMIMPTLNYGGMESFALNYFRKIDRNVISFDFVAHGICNSSYIKEIKDLGGKVYLMPKFGIKSLDIIKKSFCNILKNNKYQIIHCNMANAAFMYLRIAKQYGISVRILHSHQDKYADKISHVIRNIPLVKLGKKYANVNFACSETAGKFLFGKQSFHVIYNAIDYQKFMFDEKTRIEERNKYKFNESFVIGHTGRLCKQKNQAFIIDVFKKITEKDSSAKLVLIGDGEDRNELINKVHRYNLDNKVLLLGGRDDVFRILNAFDLFLFPSIYEGLGMSIIESQANGLETLCSDRVPDEANVSELFHRISLNQSSDYWADKIFKMKCQRKKDYVLNQKYSIDYQAVNLEKLYLQLLEENDKK